MRANIMSYNNHGLFFMSLLLLVSASLCSAGDKTVFEVIGTSECADCKENNFKTSQAFSGLRVTIDCKLKNGDTKRFGSSELDKHGNFKVSLPKELVRNRPKIEHECYAQLHSASAIPCPVHNSLEASKITLKPLNGGPNYIFAPSEKIRFLAATCTSKSFWPYFKHPPLPPFGHPWLFPPLPPFYKPKPPSTPIYEPPPVVKPPVYKPPKKPCPPTKPKPPVYKPPVEKPPVYKPPVEKPPVEKPPIYKPPVEKPPAYKPPVEKPPIYKPPVEKPPIYKPPVEKPPAYKPPVEKPPIYKPPVEKPPFYKPPIIVKPLPPPIHLYPIPPITKKPCPPLPKLPPFPKIPPKYFHHPKFGPFPPGPPLAPHP